MNKEEILERSRVENQNKDIADIEMSKSGIRAGWIVTVCFSADRHSKFCLRLWPDLRSYSSANMPG